MALLKYVNLNRHPAGSKSPDLIRNEIYYILNPSKMLHNCWGGCGLLLTEPENLILQFTTAKNVFHKENYAPLRHFVLSFSSDFDMVDVFQAQRIAYEICELFFPEHQMLFAVHENSENLHIHLLLNTINCMTGNTIHMDKSFFGRFHYALRTILSCPSSWGGYRPVKLMDGIM